MHSTQVVKVLAELRILGLSNETSNRNKWPNSVILVGLL